MAFQKRNNLMIEPERILHYFESLSYLLEDDFDRYDGKDEIAYRKRLEQFFKKFYMYSHIGTTHRCKHEDWEEEFLKDEKALIEAGCMEAYGVSKKDSTLPSLFPAKYPHK